MKKILLQLMNANPDQVKGKFSINIIVVDSHTQ